MAHPLFRQGRLNQGLLLFGILFCCAVAFISQAWAAPLQLPSKQNTGKQRELRLVLDDLSRQRAMVINMQRELVSRPAIGPENGGDGEEEKARWIESWLTERGVAYERLDFPDQRVSFRVRPNIVAVYPGRQTDRTLWLLSHLDVAPVVRRDLWKSDPFALRVNGDAMYGRGVEDNNQAIVASLLLLESLRKNGVTPPMRLGLVMTSGDVIDFKTGIGHVLVQKPELFGPDDLIVVLDGGNAEGSQVNVGEKGNLWLKFTVKGKSGRAGVPDKANNAYAVGSILANGLHELEREFPAENPLFSPPRSTLTITRTENFSTGANHIPGKFVFYADIRVLADYSFEDVNKAVRGLADEVEKSSEALIEIEQVKKTPSASVTPADAPVLAVLDRAIRAQLGLEPKHVGTGDVTAAATLRNKGFAVAVWGVQENMRYRPEECALISGHIKQAKVFARVLFDPAISPINTGTSEGQK